MAKAGADNLYCVEIISERYRPKGSAWRRYLAALRSLLRGRSSFVLLYGYYGSGKTLFIRRSIAEFAYSLPVIVPIYVKLEEVKRLAERHSGYTSVQELLADIADFMIKRKNEGYECIDEEVAEVLKKIRITLLSMTRAYPSTMELLKELTKHIPEGYKLVLFIDELEKIKEFTSVTRARPILSLIRDIFKDLYTLASGGLSYGVVVASVFRITHLIAYMLEYYYQRRVEGIISADEIRLLNDIIRTLAELLEPGARVAVLAELLAANPQNQEDLEMLRRMLRAFVNRYGGGTVDPFDSNIKSRLKDQVISLRYTSNEYLEILRDIQACQSLIDRSYSSRHVGTVLLALEAIEIPPRYILDEDCTVLKEPIREEAIRILKEMLHNEIKTLGSQIPVRLKILETLVDWIAYTKKLLLDEKDIKEIASYLGKAPSTILSHALRERILETRYIGQRYYYIPNRESGIPFYLVTGDIEQPNPQNPLTTIKESITMFIQELKKPRKTRRTKTAKQHKTSTTKTHNNF